MQRSRDCWLTPIRDSKILSQHHPRYSSSEIGLHGLCYLGIYVNVWVILLQGFRAGFGDVFTITYIQRR
jgi:hypothetical protein